MPTPECLRVDPIDEYEFNAIKAVHEGTADAHQQSTALSVIVNKFCRSHDLQYVPDHPDQGALLSGRAFVGNQILKAVRVPIGHLINKENKDA